MLDATLIEPVSEEQPIGEDLSYEPAYSVLEEKLAGQSAQYVGKEMVREAREPDWNEIVEEVQAMLGRSKDLYLMVVYATARMASGGLEGAADGLTLISETLNRYWDVMLPVLDPEEPPEERFISRRNLLQNLANPVVSPDDPFSYVQRLRKIPICQSARIGSFSLEQIHAADNSEGGAPGLGEIEAAFQEMGTEAIADLLEKATRARDAVKLIIHICHEQIGIEQSPSLGTLDTALAEISEVLARFLPTEAAADAHPGTEGELLPSQAGAARSNINTLSINSRKDARVAVEKVCEYYRQHEPASPVPLLLNRALRLMESDFLSIVEDLHPDALAQLRLITQGHDAKP